jgi:hypothetical protein
MLERVKLALESENEELRAAKPVRPSLIEALETALDLAREAARHNGGLSPGKAKKREKALTDIRSGLALLVELEKGAVSRGPSPPIHQGCGCEQLRRHEAGVDPVDSVATGVRAGIHRRTRQSRLLPRV